MKVLLISSKYPPEYAGSGFRAHNTYKRLESKYDVNFEVICNSVEFDSSARYTHEGVDVTRIVNRLAHPLSMRETSYELFERSAMALKIWAEAAATWRQLNRREFDVVHTFGHSASTAAAHYWTRRNEVPLVYEICNIQSQPKQYLPLLSRWYDYDLSRQSVVVALSPTLEEMCREHGLKENVWMRPNPVDTSRFSPESVWGRYSVSDLTKFDDSDTILLYVASFRRRKNHTFLLDVLKSLPEQYKLVLAGPVDDDGQMQTEHEEVLAELKAKVQKYGLHNRVDIQPEFVDMADYLSIADVFCFPSYDEAMGTPLVESLASGIPVVANAEESSFRTWVTDGKNGYVCELSSRAWTEAIENATGFDRDYRLTFAEEIHDTVSAEALDSRYLQLLKSVETATPSDGINVRSILGETEEPGTSRLESTGNG
jgi:glycosyltransferase involved in cell wall biosynthesis